MTLSNLSPADRIVAHETKITENIQQIKTNEQLIETQEADQITLLAEKTELDAKSPSFWERATFDNSLKDEKAAKKLAVEEAREETTALKQDNYALKLDTLSEKDKLKQAQLDEEALLQQSIAETEDSIKRSEDRINRLESHSVQDSNQTEKIQKEQAELAKKEKNLADSKESAAKAQEASQTRDAKVADEVKEKCPIQCYANTINIKSGNTARNYSLSANLNQPGKTLHVISVSKESVDKGFNRAGVSTISAYLEGKCEKGLPQSSALSADKSKLVRDASGQACPVMKVNKDDINLTLPGTSSEPLMFDAYCTPPSTGLMAWKDLFRDIIFPQYRTPPIEYLIESKGCDGSYPLVSKVAAHQKIKVELELGITYKKTEKIQKLKDWKFNHEAKNLVEDYNKGHRTVEMGNWLFTIDLKGNIDHTNLATQLQYLNPADCLAGLRTAINSFIFLFDIIRICTNDNIGSNITGIEYLADKIIDNKADTIDEKGKASAEGPTGNISIVYPKMALNLTYENCEAEGKNILGHSTSVAVKLSPLIGVNCKVDILGALIKIASNALIPGASAGGKAFVKFIWPIIKELSSDKGIQTTPIDEKNKSYFLNAGISLTMDIGANISCEGKFTHIKDAGHLGLADVEPTQAPESGAKSPVTTTDSSALEIKLEGKVWVKGKVWVVEFEAGLIMALGGASAPGPAKMEYKVNLSEVDQQIMVEGQYEWNGLAIFYQSYKTVAVKSKDNDDQNTNDSDAIDDFDAPLPENTETEVGQTLTEADTRKQWVLIEPGKTPDTPDKIPLNDYLFSFTKPVKKAFRFFRRSE